MTRKKETPELESKDDLGSLDKEGLEKVKLRIDIERARFDMSLAELHFRREQAFRDARGAFHIPGYIDSSLAVRLSDDMDVYSAMSPGGKIIVHIHSPGGNVFPGLAILDRLEQAKRDGHHVTTVNHGYAASMAGIILQAGHTRVMMPDAYLMIHEVASGVIGKLSEMTDETELAKRLQVRLFDILAERSTLSARQIKTRTARKDWWLDAQEALKYGFIDQIWSA